MIFSQIETEIIYIFLNDIVTNMLTSSISLPIGISLIGTGM